MARFAISSIRLSSILLLIAISLQAAANERGGGSQEIDSAIAARIKADLMKKYPGARVEINGAPQWIKGALAADAALDSLRIIGDTPKGEIQFMIGSDVQGAISYSAWAPTLIAARRIMPSEKLKPEMFVQQEINVAIGTAREYRGVILGAESDLSRLEARLTILEGQFPLATSVQRIPDVRRGDAVRIKLVSGELSLMTQGLAEEPAYVDGKISVMTSKTKRMFTGKLQPGGIVEVKL